MPQIRLDNVSVHYHNDKKNLIIAGLYQASLTIADQSFTVIVGPSGCGKTTLLKTIAGIIDVAEGSIYFDDINMDSVSSNKRNVSFVSQQFALYPNMSVFDNIAYPLKVAKTPIEEMRNLVNQIAETLELSILLSRRPRHLSIGQKQRVALARALVKQPQVILLDEPFSNLDQPTRLYLRDLLKKMQKRYLINVILSTHNQDDAYFLADQLVMINNGSIEKVIEFKDGHPL